MKALPFDLSRCAGRFEFGEDAKWCKEKESCMRYQSFVSLDALSGLVSYKGMSVMMGKPVCDDKIPV